MSDKEEITTEISKQDPDQPSSDMTNMFESVWVKVEPKDEIDADENDCDNETIEKTPPKSKKKHKNRKPLNCDSCDYTTIYKNCLDLHKLSHSGLKPHSCKICSFTTKSPTSLQRHMMSQHQIGIKNTTPFKCDKCDYTTLYKWNLKSHNRKHSNEEQYKCMHCDYATAYRHNYQKHNKKHRQNTVFKCDKCPFRTKYEGHITRHLAKIHNEITETAHRCDYCDFSTVTKWRLTIHIGRSRQDAPLKCSHCEFETQYMCESKKHKTVHFNEIYKRTSAKQCSEVKENPFEKDDDAFESIDRDVYTDKTQNHKDGNDSSNYTLDQHCVDWKSIQVLESNDKNKPFQCVMCSYSSRFKASVQRHFQRHHTGSQNKPYKCVNCDFSTKTKDQIALHNKRSKSDIGLVCQECNFTTTFKCQLAMHQKCHYTHRCNGCEYSCRNKYDLQKHYINAHSGELLKCQYCEYKAARKDTLLCHMTIHTGNKPYACEHCDYTSVRKSLVNFHMKRYHSDIKSDVKIVSDEKIESLRTVEENEESNLAGFQELMYDS